MKVRLDQLLTRRQLVSTRSQAGSYIRLGQVKVNGRVITKSDYFVAEDAKIQFGTTEQYVSRAALKLASVAQTLKLSFKGKTVLDVGSSTGGFTDYALQHGAKRVIAVEVGTNQLHAKLRADERVELHEKTDIRDFRLSIMDDRSEKPGVEAKATINNPQSIIDIVVIDVSFISLQQILPHISKLISHDSQIVAMFKPQFEADDGQLNKGVVKNSALRRELLKDFEIWCRNNKFVVIVKSDSSIAGEKGNVERFYLLKVGH